MGWAESPGLRRCVRGRAGPGKEATKVVHRNGRGELWIALSDGEGIETRRVRAERADQPCVADTRGCSPFLLQVDSRRARFSGSSGPLRPAGAPGDQADRGKPNVRRVEKVAGHIGAAYRHASVGRERFGISENNLSKEEEGVFDTVRELLVRTREVRHEHASSWVRLADSSHSLEGEV
jgi:hypothetical protein